MIEMVYIFRSFDTKPVYHDYGTIADLGDGRSGDITVCGLLMYETSTLYAARLRRDHADLFARPCRKCFPDLARVAAEDRAATVHLYGEERVAELEQEANR